jgi:hypothetical protein
MVTESDIVEYVDDLTNSEVRIVLLDVLNYFKDIGAASPVYYRRGTNGYMYLYWEASGEAVGNIVI